MPGKMTPAQEKDWKKSKKNVRDEKGKSQKKFKDMDWGLVQHIYKLRREKHTGKPFKKKKKKSNMLIPLTKIAVSVIIEPQEPLVQKAVQLIESKAPGYFANNGIKHVVVESGDPGHLGKAESDKTDTIFVSSDKIKSLVGAQNEDEIVRQIAITLAHEVGHQKDKFKGGEGPAQAEEKQMESKLSQIQERSRLRKAALQVIAADEPSPEAPADNNAEALKGMQKRIRQLSNQIKAQETLIREMETDPSSFPQFNSANLKKEIEKRRAILEQKLSEVDQLQSTHVDLTGNIFEVGKIETPDIGAAKAKKTTTPVAEPTEIQSTQVAEDATSETSDKLLLRMRGNVLRRALTPKEEAVNRIVHTTPEGKLEHTDVANPLATKRQADKQDVALNITLYMLGKGPEHMKFPGDTLDQENPQFLKGQESYLGMKGEQGNRHIKNELDTKSANLITYLTELGEEHAKLADASKRAKLLGINVPSAAAVLKQEENSKQKGTIDSTAPTSNIPDKGKQVVKAIIALRDRVNETAHKIERHIENSLKRILPHVMVPDITLQKGTSEKDLSPAVRQIVQEQLAPPSPDERTAPWKDQTMPGAKYHGTERAQEAMRIAPGSPEAEAPLVPPTRRVNESDEDFNKRVEDYQRRLDEVPTASQTHPATPGSSQRKINGPAGNGVGYGPSVQKGRLPIKKRQSVDIPLSKVAARKPGEEGSAEERWRRQMQTEKMPTTDKRNPRGLGPVATSSEDVEALYKRWAAKMAEFEPATEFGSEPSFAPGSTGRADPTNPEFADMDLSEQVNPEPASDLHKRLETLRELADAFAKDWKAFSGKKVDRAQKQKLRSIVIKLRNDIKTIEKRIEMSTNWMEKRRTGLPASKIRPTKSETGPTKKSPTDSPPWTPDKVINLKNKVNPPVKK